MDHVVLPARRPLHPRPECALICAACNLPPAFRVQHVRRATGGNDEHYPRDRLRRAPDCQHAAAAARKLSEGALQQDGPRGTAADGCDRVHGRRDGGVWHRGILADPGRRRCCRQRPRSLQATTRCEPFRESQTGWVLVKCSPLMYLQMHWDDPETAVSAYLDSLS